MRMRRPGHLLLEQSKRLFPDVWAEPMRPKVKPTGTLYSSWSDEGIPKDDLDRRRFRGRVPEVLAAAPRLAKGWALMRFLLSKKPDAFRFVVVDNKMDDVMKAENFKEILGYLSDYWKKKGHPMFKYIVDLATLDGYAPLLTDDEVMEKSMDWFGRKKDKGNDPTYYDRFRLNVRRFLRRAVGDRTIKEHLTLEQYAENPIMWGTAGSVLYYKPRTVTGVVEGREVTADKSKWGAALSIPPEEVLSSLRSRRSQYAKVVQKRETKKSRLIVSTDLETHWKMDFVSKAALDQLFMGSDLSPIWMTGAQLRQYWLDVTDFTDGAVRMPLDQDAFDQEQPARSVQVTLEELELLLHEYNASSEVMDTLRFIQYGIKHGYVLVPKGTGYVKVPYKNGILSGWRWTAMLDTIINAASFETAAERVLPSMSALLGYKAQGDDLQTRFTDYLSAAAVWQAMTDDGYKVNPSKFFLSTERDEFLRKIITENKVDGYPARAVNSVLWRNPVNRPPSPGQDRMSEMLSQWAVVLNRFEIPLKVLIGTIASDIAGANETSPAVVRDWIYTPASLGGGGYVSDNSQATGFTKSVREDEPVLVGTLPGLSSTVRQAASLTQGIITEKAVLNWADRLVNFPTKTFTRAVPVKVHPYPPVNIFHDTPVQIPEPPKGLVAQYLGMDPIAYGAAKRAFFPDASDSIRGDVLLRRLSLVAPRVEGVSHSFVSSSAKEYIRRATSRLLGMRQPNQNGWKAIQYGYEKWFSNIYRQKRTFSTPHGEVLIAD